MALYLTNEQIAGLLTPEDCLNAIEKAYLEKAARQTADRPRTDLWAPSIDANTQYIFKSMEGVIPSMGVVALRINSDVIKWSESNGIVRKDKVPLAKGGRWVGLVFLFSTETGELLAIFPDGFVQSLRVAATTALAVKCMARPDASVLGLYGSGQQAGAAAEMVSRVRSLQEVRVYSPNRDNRTRFATQMAEKTGLSIRAVDDPRQAAVGVDLVLAATNAITPVFAEEWIAPGAHISCVKYQEIAPALIRRANVLAVNSREHSPINYMVGRDGAFSAHDPVTLNRKDDGDPIETYRQAGLDFARAPELQDVMTGNAPSRMREDDITCFINNIGLGIQFAAAGKRAYDLAREKGVGQELPDEMFSEDMHP